MADLAPGEQALTFARAGIARSNATRSNYIRPHITVLLTKYRAPAPPATVDVSNWVRLGSLRVTQAINDEPDTCALTFVPQLPAEHIPIVGDVIAVGLATEHVAPPRIAGGLEFAGPIVVKQHERRNENKSPWIAVTCQDWQWFLDAQLVNASWPAQAADVTIRDVLARYVNFSQLVGAIAEPFALDAAVGTLPSVPAFEAINWRPSDVLRHVANAILGGFYIDPFRTIHVWANGPEPAVSNPQPLTNDRRTLKTFRHTIDASQIRRRVVVEGQTTSTLVDTPNIPGGSGAYTGGIPVDDPRAFAGATRLARFGSQWVQITVAHPIAPDATNPFIAKIIAGGFVPDLHVDSFPPYLTPGVGAGWIKIGDMLLRYTFSRSDGTGGYFLTLPTDPSLPFARPNTPIAVGDKVAWIEWVDTWTRDGHVPGLDGSVGQNTASILAAPKGTPLVVRAEARDPDVTDPAAPHLPPIEALVSDGRYGYDGATQRANEDLAFFKAPAIKAQWITEDYNARPGRGQVIALTGADPVAATLTILTCDLDFPLRSLAPRRSCTAAAVKPSTLLDVLVTSNTENRRN